MTRVGEHAIVIGASMGGLLARGRDVIEDFFPGWADEVVASGGVKGDLAGDVNWIGHGVTLKSAPCDLIGLFASRPVLEGHVRRRLLALSNVRAIETCAVQGLIASDDKTAIRGVRIRVGNQAEQVMLADLVVDASGRGLSSAAWLECLVRHRRCRPAGHETGMLAVRRRRIERSFFLGYARPKEERVEIGLGYTTRVYRRRGGDLGGKLAVVVAGSGPNWRNGALLFQSEDRWIVSVGGFFGDHAPDDQQLFAAYVRSLPTSDIHDIVAHAEPLSDFVTYRYPANLRHRYEQLTRFPKNYLVVADAICSFNPVYGQGMTVAAEEAAVLRDCLRAGDSDLARRFFNAAKTAIDTPWEIAVGNDLRHPQVGSARPPKVRFINWYIGKLHVAARRDSVLANAFLKVANLVAPPQMLLHPVMVARVIWGNNGRQLYADAKPLQADAQT